MVANLPVIQVEEMHMRLLKELKTTDYDTYAGKLKKVMREGFALMRDVTLDDRLKQKVRYDDAREEAPSFSIDPKARVTVPVNVDHVLPVDDIQFRVDTVNDAVPTRVDDRVITTNSDADDEQPLSRTGPMYIADVQSHMRREFGMTRDDFKSSGGLRGFIQASKNIALDPYDAIIAVTRVFEDNPKGAQQLRHHSEIKKAVKINPKRAQQLRYHRGIKKKLSPMRIKLYVKIQLTSGISDKEKDRQDFKLSLPLGIASDIELDDNNCEPMWATLYLWMICRLLIGHFFPPVRDLKLRPPVMITEYFEQRKDMLQARIKYLVDAEVREEFNHGRTAALKSLVDIDQRWRSGCSAVGKNGW
ncbi:hypothetical protein FOZ63_000841, partial [Perkinsus olseni]